MFFEFLLMGLLEGQQLSIFYYQGYLVPIDVVSVVGNSLHYILGKRPLLHEKMQLHERMIQAFGSGTTEYLANLTGGIAGVSGTGSIVA